MQDCDCLTCIFESISRGLLRNFILPSGICPKEEDLAAITQIIKCWRLVTSEIENIGLKDSKSR